MSNIPDGFGSTALNGRIESYADLVYRVKSILGYPAAPIELTDAQWAHIIDKAIEDYTAFEGDRVEEYLIFCADSYKHGCGVKLDDLLSVGCNYQHCYTTTVVEQVTSTYQTCSDIETSTAYLSVTPFIYPPTFNINNPYATPFSGVSGQNFHLYFDPDNPWDAMNVCGANCVTIEPVNSEWFNISSNPLLSSTVFDFVNSPILSGVLDTISQYVTAYDYDAVPLSALGDLLSAIPVRYYPLSAFYSEDELVGEPVKICLNIGQGRGTIYPNCNTDLISTCAPLSSQYTVWDGAPSGASGTDVSGATHIRLYGVPSCTTDGSIPLEYNDGILSTFTICNSSFSTNGPMTIKKAQFFNDSKPPVEILYDQNCNWENNGFTFSFYNSAYGECVRHTPILVPVNVTFKNCNTVTEIGTVSTVVSSNVDSLLNRKRKVLGVFNADTTSSGGYFGGGGDLLFNFDYALMANTFGYDLMGNRNMLGKQGYDLLTYHMARSFVEHSKKMLRYVSYTFNPKTQYLKLIPEPQGAVYNCPTGCTGTGITNPNSTQCYFVGVYLEPPIEDVINSYFVKEYVLAQAMVTLGNIRSTYGGVVLFGGATLTGDALISRGQERIKELMAELRDEYRYSAPPAFIVA